MNISAQWLPWIVGAVSVLLTYGACRWSYGRRLADLIHRAQRVDHARQTAEELVRQARQQIEQLKVEVAFERRARAGTSTQRLRAQAVAGINTAFERQAPTRPSHPAQGSRPALPPDGFADTQPV